MADLSERPILFFAHERGDARVRKRISAFQDLGKKVIGFTFHRERDKIDPLPAWENIHLGNTYNGRYFHRLWTFARCLGLLWRERHRIGEAGVIYVVNWDNALLALLARGFSGKRIPMVLELADVLSAMTNPGWRSRIFRAVERFVLRRSALLVTTSPGFIREYFVPFQKYEGEIFLLENKVYPGRSLPESSLKTGKPVEGGRPWRIGFFGAIRCAESLRLMKALAIKLGDKVEFVLRGYPSGRIVDEFHELIDEVPNLIYGGAYLYPEDLGELYTGIDLNWAFDESDAGGNSDWLLPNRIYEGGSFGVPSLSAARTETGRWVIEHQQGWAFPDPLEKSLRDFLNRLTVEEWSGMKERCLKHPREDFSGDKDYLALVRKMEQLQ